MRPDAWRGCYDGGWADLIVPEAFAHPAKYSRALIARIYEHAKAEGWLQPGDVVLDPFGGVGLGALDAMRLGLSWCGMELEQKFVDLGNQNIALWNRRYGHVAGWGTARLIQGDSSKLAEVVAGAGLTVSSPPWESSGTQCPAFGSSQAVNNSDRAWVQNWEKGAGRRPRRLTAKTPPTSATFPRPRAGWRWRCRVRRMRTSQIVAATKPLTRVSSGVKAREPTGARSTERMTGAAIMEQPPASLARCRPARRPSPS